MILRIFRLVLAPALKLPIFGHGVEMARSRQLGDLFRPWSKESPEIITHGASKTKARKHLTIRFGIEPDFVDKLLFHWNVLLGGPSCDKIAMLQMPNDLAFFRPACRPHPSYSISMFESPSRISIISSTTYEYV